MEGTLDDDQKKVLKEVRNRSMDGYSLLSKTGLDRLRLIASLESLVGNALVRVTGELGPDTFGDSVISVPIDAIGEVDLVLGTLRGRTTYRR